MNRAIFTPRCTEGAFMKVFVKSTGSHKHKGNAQADSTGKTRKKGGIMRATNVNFAPPPESYARL
jgi:hypothetical protein